MNEIMETPQRVNAEESWPLYDSLVVMNNVNSLYPNAAWYQQYSDIAVPADLPLFNVRNKSVGEAYCNFDSSDKMAFAYEIFALGILVAGPAVSGIKIGESTPSAANQTRPGDIFFASEVIRHSTFILKVGQDEKLVAPVSSLPAGEGIAGLAKIFDDANNTLGLALSNLGNGVPLKRNMWVFPKPIRVPRDRNISGTLVFSNYLRTSLAKCAGPGQLLNSATGGYPDKYPSASLIRVTMLGRRYVQQRNELAYY
jgi:hypothetical protein